METHLAQWPLWLHHPVVLAYRPMPLEVDLSALWQQRFPDKTWLFPRLNTFGGNDNSALTLHALQAVARWRRWSFGLEEPAQDTPVYEGQPTLALIPAWLMDARGYRLGYGGGYYDRLLAGWQQAGVQVLTLGVVPHGQWVTALPADPWDLPLDGVLTEQGVFLTSKGHSR